MKKIPAYNINSMFECWLNNIQIYIKMLLKMNFYNVIRFRYFLRPIQTPLPRVMYDDISMLNSEQQ